MHPFAQAALSLGGVALTGDLATTPSQRQALARSANRGEVQRLRRGVYAAPGTHPDVALAAAVGGRVAGVSALWHHGLWVPPAVSRVLHVEVGDNVDERPDADPRRDVRVHWVASATVPRFGVAPLDSVLARVADDLPLPYAVAVLDSALRATPVTPVDLQFLAANWSSAARAVAALADVRSESGTESVLRVLLHEAGIHATPQAPLPIGDHERADLLVGDRLLIECDSEAHHADPTNRRADLRRDEVLVSLGYIVLRLDYGQVLGDPSGVVATIAAILARGDHLSRHPGA